MEHLWEIAQAHGDLDKYGENFVRKQTNLLHQHHSGFMLAKLRVIEARNRIVQTLMKTSQLREVSALQAP